MLGALLTQGLGARAGQGAKCLPLPHPLSIQGHMLVWTCVSTNSAITLASSAAAGENSCCQKWEPKSNFPVQFHFQKLQVPYCSHWVHCLAEPWSDSMAVSELEATAGTGAHTLPTNLVHPHKCRHYVSVQTEELPLVTEACAEKVSMSVQSFALCSANVVCACIQLP